MKMKLTDLRIVFMGTPDFAVASLQFLVDAGCQVLAVVTAPDKPAGRGMLMHQSAVKKYALEKNIPVLQPVKLKDEEFIEDLIDLAADVYVVVAFRMLPEIVWNMPKMGTINVHASLLPQYRGAAPINWAVMNGERETGVTTFRLEHEIDTGQILLQEKTPIGDDETAGELYERLKILGASVLLKTLEQLAEGSLRARPQLNPGDAQSVVLHKAPKIFTETCRIDWTRSSLEIHNQVRGLSPVPGAFTELQGKQLKIFRSAIEKTSPSVAPGQWITDQKTQLKFACADGYLQVLELQLEGKKKMGTEEFLRGYRWTH